MNQHPELLAQMASAHIADLHRRAVRTRTEGRFRRTGDRRSAD